MSEPALARGNSAPTSLQLRGAPGGLLVLTLPGVMRFDALRVELRDLFTESPGRFKGARIRLDLGTRDLDLLEIRRLVHMTKDEFDVEIVGLQCENASLQRMAERELKLKITPTVVEPDPVVEIEDPHEADPEPTKVANYAGPNFETEDGSTDIVSPPGEEGDEQDAGLGGRVLVVNGTVRSGACVRFGGDVQIFGDVNPGAQVIAGGNILVLGALKGMAHAGTRDDSSVILAFDLRPTQLRIGKVIGVVPGADPDKASRAFVPEVASILEGRIAVEPYRGKLPAPQQKENA